MRWAFPVAIFVVALIVGHLLVLSRIPVWKMEGAMDQISRDGKRINRWIEGDQPSPETRGVVRPARNLVYSICIFDLSNGPLSIHVEPWSSYWSLSAYATNTDNFATWNDRTDPQGVDLTLLGPDISAPASATNPFRSRSDKGVLVVRRLVTDYQKSRPALERVREEDICTPLNN